MSRYSRLLGLIHTLQCKGTRGSRTSARLPVVLQKDVEGLGGQGDTVLVKHGYAHNLLVPNRLAIVPPKPKRERGERKSESVVDQAAQAQQQQQQLELVLKHLQLGTPLEVKEKLQGDGTLRERITAASLAKLVAEQRRVELAKDIIELTAPISEVGEYNVPLGITLADGQLAMLTVSVAAQKA